MSGQFFVFKFKQKARKYAFLLHLYKKMKKFKKIVDIL